MAHSLSPLPARDLVLTSRSAASAAGPVAVEDLVTEFSPYFRDLRESGSDFQRIADQIVQLAKILTGASGSAIAFRGAQGTICLARSGEGAPPLGAPVDITSGISKQCLVSGASLRCDDIATDGRVDPEVAQAIGIRAVAVAPIYSDGEISGILEVFSGIPGTFTDRDLQRLERLADCVGSAANTGSPPRCVSNRDDRSKSQSAPVFLVESEPAYRTFFRNLADLVTQRSAAPPLVQLQGWNDVFVESPLPWKRFLASVFLHIVVIGMLAGLSEIWPRELDVSTRSLREAHVTYYSFSQSFPAHRSSRPATHPILQYKGPRAVTSVLPPKIAYGAERPLHLPNFPKVAPPPELSGGSGFRRVNAPGVGAVPPPPDLRGSMRRPGLIAAGRVGGVAAGAADVAVVPPPPSLNDHAVLVAGARGGLFETGVQAVAPPPSIPVGAAAGAGGRAVSLGGGGSQVVGPPPSLEGSGNGVGGRRLDALWNGGSQVVGPPPLLEGGGNSGAGGRSSLLARAGADGALPPASRDRASNSVTGSAGVANVAPAPSLPDAGGNRTSPIVQDVQLRVIGLAWAPPRSSYFSNFEVLIAEKWSKKEESELIKLVYVFLPYQTRLSEHGLEDLKIRKLRVTRDPACDESLIQMKWSGSENGLAGKYSGDTSAFHDAGSALPCYRTTADDYRRSVARR